MRKICIQALAAFAACSTLLGAQIYVSQNGSDTRGNGSKQSPFATLKAASEKAKIMLKSAPERGEPVEIVVGEGNYFFKSDKDCVRFDKTCSGTDKNPFIVRGEGKVNFIGGVRVPVSDLRLVKDRNILSRLPEKVSGKLFYLDLKKYGIEDCGKMGTRGFGVANPYPPTEAFFTDFEFVLARYPNTGAMNWTKTIDIGKAAFASAGKRNTTAEHGGTIEYSDPRHERWTKAEDLWLSGIFNYGWAYNTVKVQKLDTEKKQIEIATLLPYGIKEKDFLDLNAYFAFNLLEEIDSAGEYYIDRKNCIFYVMLDKRPSKGAYIDFSVIQAPFIRADDLENLRVSGINFENTRGSALIMYNCKNTTVENCNFKNLGSRAVEFQKKNIPFVENKNPPLLSANNTIRNCSAVNTGMGGFYMNVGERVNLVDGNGLIENCTLSDNARIGRSYCPGINIGGVGVRVRHCRITNQTHEGIALGGNEHLIECNYFDRCSTEFDDMGAIYTGRNQSECGNIIRYNFFAQITPKKPEAMMCGVYIDDGSGRYLIEKNIFCRVGNPGKNNLFAAVFFHGGDGNVVKQNIFVDCAAAVACTTWSNYTWTTRVKHNDYKLTKEVDMLGEVYLKKYPDLKDVLKAERDRQNFIIENLFCDTNLTQRGKFTLEKNNYIKPDNGEPLPKIDFWTLDEFAKLFGKNPLAKEILEKKPGLLK